MSTPKRFEFRLARVKRVREIEERVARAAWSSAERTATEAEARCDAARERIADARRAPAGEIDPTRILLGHRATDGLLQGLLRSKEAALTLRGQAARLGQAWQGREVDRRALEELETRARERHRVAREREEAKEMDETGIARSRRGRPDAPGQDRETGSSHTPRPTDEGRAR